jgi:hypothetical protein
LRGDATSIMRTFTYVSIKVAIVKIDSRTFPIFLWGIPPGLKGESLRGGFILGVDLETAEVGRIWRRAVRGSIAASCYWRESF